jgi:hypothetical protein
VHEDAGVSSDGHVGWALALSHGSESSNVGGVVDGTFSIASPVNQSFSGVVEEAFLDILNVRKLASHFTDDRSFNFSCHLLEGAFGFMGISSHNLEMSSSNSLIKVKGAVGVSGASAHESFSWWSRGESSVFLGKALGILVVVTVIKWLDPLSESFKCMDTFFNDSSLMLGNIIDSIFGGSVEVLED